MRRLQIVCVALGALAASAPSALAQAPPPAREGSAEFALVATSGNTSTRTVGLGGDVTFRPARWVYRARSSFVQNKVNNVVSARTFTTSFRGALTLSRRASVFGQVSYLRNRFSGISHRSAVEAGVSGAWERGRHKVNADGTAGYANERRIVGADLSTGVAGAGLRYAFRLSATAEFTDETRYVQSLATAADFRFDHIAAVSAQLTSQLSLKVANTVRYVNAPVAGFKTTDTITSMALVAKF